MPSKKLKPGDECPGCFRALTSWSFDEGRRRKTQNATNTHKKLLAKFKETGVWPGGRPKVRDDAEIKRLRKKGLSIRAIANEIGLSTSAVQRGLKP